MGQVRNAGVARLNAGQDSPFRRSRDERSWRGVRACERTSRLAAERLYDEQCSACQPVLLNAKRPQRPLRVMKTVEEDVSGKC